MSLDAYNSGRNFERLLKKVYPSNHARALQSLMRNAISMEQGEQQAKSLGSTRQQFEEAKEQVRNTINKLTTTTPYNSYADYFESYLMVLVVCKSTSCLMEVVDGALAKANTLD